MSDEVDAMPLAVEDGYATMRGLPRSKRPATLPEYLARDLASYIVDRKLPEGTRLPPEREMRESLRVGKGTLREALRLLQTRGVITMRAGRMGGPVVRRPRSTDLSDALALILAYEATTVMDVMNARVALEPVIVRLAAQRISKRQIAVLQKTIDSMLEHVGEHEVFLEQNVKFFATLAEASGNPALKVVNEMLKVVIDGSVQGALFPESIHRKTAEAHQRICAALSVKDADKAEAEMRDHLSNASRYWNSKFRSIVKKHVRWDDSARAF
jgi:DNA-binding FadR family transcriptional regulator